MLVDVIRHQHEKIGNAVRALMSLTLPAPQRLERAARELALAFRGERPPEWAATHVAAIRGIVAGTSDAAERPREPDGAQLDALSAAFFDLYTVACREYWTA